MFNFSIRFNKRLSKDAKMRWTFFHLKELQVIQLINSVISAFSNVFGIRVIQSKYSWAPPPRCIIFVSHVAMHVIVNVWLRPFRDFYALPCNIIIAKVWTDAYTRSSVIEKNWNSDSVQYGLALLFRKNVYYKNEFILEKRKSRPRPAPRAWIT